MKPLRAFSAFVLLFASLYSPAQQGVVTSSNAAVPTLVNFNGLLTDVNGKLLTGITGVTFYLYKEQQDGAPLWMETQNVQPDKTGRYSVMLGSTTSQGLPSDLFVSGEARWLGVQAQGQAEQPRVMLLSVPYALKAGDAATVGGLPPSAFVLAAPTTGSNAASSSVSGTGNGAPALAGSGTLDFVPLWTPDGNTLGNSAMFQSGASPTAKIGINTSKPASALDVAGNATVRGPLALPSSGTATASGGKNSQPVNQTASVFNSSTSKAVNQVFQWQAEPAGNNTSSPSGTLNLLFASGTRRPAETGLNIASNGQITFAPGQTFPGTGTITGVTTANGSGLMGGATSGTLNLSLTNSCAANQVLQWNGSAWACSSAGTGTVTSVGSGTGLTGGPITGSGTLSIAPGGVSNAMLANPALTINPGTALTGGGPVSLGGATTLNVDPTQVPFLVAANTFTGNQTVNGNLSSTGLITGSGYQLGSNLFDYGSYANGNAFLGFAGNGTTAGFFNTASGYQALFSNTTGNGNTASGESALYSNTTGSQNTASGTDALVTNTTGSNNTATGELALGYNTTGSNNTATGLFALINNTTGTSNLAAGYYALSAATGSNNTGLGAFAGNPTGSGFITGSNNTYVGFGANSGTQLNFNNATAIGANAQVSESNAIVLGSINGVNGATANTNVGIGTTTPASTLDVHGTGNFTGLVTFAPNQTFPGVGTVTSVGSGAGLTGGPITGSGSLSIANGGVSNAMLTNPSLTINPGTALTGGGPVSLGGATTLNLDTTKVPLLAAANSFTANQTVYGNLTATGVVTGSSYQIGTDLFAFGSSANANAFLGFAGNTNTVGGSNTAAGVYALLSNTYGHDNTATGHNALLYNTTGSDNTASGTTALLLNTTGNFNTATGTVALEYNTTGAFNTADGFASGQSLNGYITGSNNTLLGTNTALSTGTLSNATAIGANAEVAATNAMVLGSINGVNGCTPPCSDTLVGIGTTAPSSPLTVVGNSTYIPLAIQSPSTFGTWMTLGNTSAGGATWNILSAASGNSEGAGNLAFTNFNANSTVYIHANLHVDGAVSKGGGSFQIDHPLDPANKYLYHSFVESPDMMNVYNGNITTDKRGLATVTLPDYFEALNRDFRYQLTVIGQFAQAIVAKEISSNCLTIKTNRPDVKVSWQVTGIRHDAYADAHRIPVEEDKPPQEQGKYLHPELYGVPQQLAIGTQHAISEKADLGNH